MIRFLPSPWFLARLFLGFIFTSAGIMKLMDPVENLRGLLADYTVIPYGLTHLTAVALPWFEVLFGVALLVGWMPRISALALALLSLGFFVVLLISKVVLGILPETCGCFGDTGIQLTTTQVMVLDVFDFLLGLKLFMLRDHPWSLDAWLKKH